MRVIKNGDTSHLIHVLMVDSTDHITAKTGLTLTVTRSKNGAAFASWGGSAAEVANGWYKLTPASGDVDTQGELVIHCTGTAADPADVNVCVVAYDPHAVADLGLSNLNATVSSRATQTSVDTVDDFLDTEIAAIKAKTDNLPASPAAVGSAMTLDGTQAFADDATSSNKLSFFITILRALANGKMTVVSGLQTMKGLDNTTTVGNTRTISGTVPSDFTRS